MAPNKKRRENLAGSSLLRCEQLNSHCRGIMFNLKNIQKYE